MNYSIIRKINLKVLKYLENNPEIDFYYIKGNHDRVDFMEEGIDEIPSNFHLFSKDGWISYRCDDVVITGIELDSSNSNTIAERLVLDSADTNIVMLHGQKSDYDGKDGAEIINTTAFKGKFIDYMALGHIHKYSLDRLDDRGVYCYSGCLEGRGFDETGDKGFVLLEVEDGTVYSEFIPFSSRRLHEIELPVDPQMDIHRVFEIADERVADVDKVDMVKFVLTGERQMDDELDVERLLRRYRDKFFFVKCYDYTKTLIDYDSYLVDKSLKGEFVRMVQAQDMDDQKKAKIIEIGIKAIMGEDI